MQMRVEKYIKTILDVYCEKIQKKTLIVGPSALTEVRFYSILESKLFYKHNAKCTMPIHFTITIEKI